MILLLVRAWSEDLLLISLLLDFLLVFDLFVKTDHYCRWAETRIQCRDILTLPPGTAGTRRWGLACLTRLLWTDDVGLASYTRKKSRTNLHLVHALLGVPMQESLALEHGCELVVDTLEQILDGRRVSKERNGHFRSTWRDVALRCKDVVWNPLNEVCRILALHVLHLLINLFHGNLSAKDGRNLESRLN